MTRPPGVLSGVTAGTRAWFAAAARADGPLAVGRAYLAQHPTEREAARLAQLLGLPPADSTAEFGAWLRTQVATDFAAGRTVVIRQWVLSITEARACALAMVLGAAI